MCSDHTTHFSGACGACQREQLARWRRQLADATALARNNNNRRSSAHTPRTYSAAAGASRAR